MIDKSVENIRNMFDEISPRYDLLNHLFSLGQDILWRKRICKYIKANNLERNKIIDIASGTGDMTKELLGINPKTIYSVDISEKMLEIQKKKINDTRVVFYLNSADDLPVDSGSIDLMTICFGVRNFEDLQKSLIEFKRVLKPGGYMIILEMFGNIKQSHLLKYYFRYFVTRFGKVISKNENAYNYLNISVSNFLSYDEFTSVAEKCGFFLVNSHKNFLNFVKTLYFKI